MFLMLLFLFLSCLWGFVLVGGVSTLIATSLRFAKSSTADALGLVAKYVILIFAALAALSQLQIAEILIQTLFIGFVAMLALAGGLAFGLGGKEVVKELLEAIKKAEVKDLQHEVREMGKERDKK